MTRSLKWPSKASILQSPTRSTLRAKLPTTQLFLPPEGCIWRLHMCLILDARYKMQQSVMSAIPHSVVSAATLEFSHPRFNLDAASGTNSRLAASLERGWHQASRS